MKRALLALVLLPGLFTACAAYQSEDCSAYADQPMKNVPARCVHYFENGMRNP